LARTPVSASGELVMTDALLLQARDKGIYAYDFEGIRYDLGDKLGYLKAVVEYALRDKTLGSDFNEYLTDLVIGRTN
ncbi:MAG: UTP--glucose-1-phosphate uridylyltransferase, partial [Clostridia bacterium]